MVPHNNNTIKYSWTTLQYNTKPEYDEWWNNCTFCVPHHDPPHKGTRGRHPHVIVASEHGKMDTSGDDLYVINH